jgi:hypothetical protein
MATVNVTDETSSESGVRTFRGRTVEEILPQVRAELGADAIVLSRREGLSGGVAGFFQRSYAEVDARAAMPEDRPRPVPRPETLVRNDRATEEGLASPAIQALVEQAGPFAAALTRAEGAVADRTQDVLIAAARGAAPGAGLYGPQPNYAEPAADEAPARYLVSPASPSPAAPGFGDVTPASPSPAAPGFGDVTTGFGDGTCAARHSAIWPTIRRATSSTRPRPVCAARPVRSMTAVESTRDPLSPAGLTVMVIRALALP